MPSHQPDLSLLSPAGALPTEKASGVIALLRNMRGIIARAYRTQKALLRNLTVLGVATIAIGAGTLYYSHEQLKAANTQAAAAQRSMNSNVVIADWTGMRSGD